MIILSVHDFYFLHSIILISDYAYTQSLQYIHCVNVNILYRSVYRFEHQVMKHSVSCSLGRQASEIITDFKYKSYTSAPQINLFWECNTTIYKCILHLQILKCCYPFIVYACKYARTYTLQCTYICIYCTVFNGVFRLVASGWGVNTVNTYLICQIRGPWAQGHPQTPWKGGGMNDHGIASVCALFWSENPSFELLDTQKCPWTYSLSTPPPPDNGCSGVAPECAIRPGLWIFTFD
jgi:hypothetical protein